jgi:flagellar protein FlaI
MRHRPDLIMVGEIRGSEAYTLFQALATGHGGMATMHADSVDSAVKRLIQKPMDISPAYMPLMNIVASIQRVHLPQSKTGEMTAYRRILSVDEIADYEDYRNTFTWKAAGDTHKSKLKNGIMLDSITESKGVSWKELMTEMKHREDVLRWMRSRNIRSYKDVAGVITEYNAKPEEFYEKEVLADAPVKNS